MEDLAPSTQWALDKLEKANTIYEPSEKSWTAQTANLIVWTLECAYIAWLVLVLMDKG